MKRVMSMLTMLAVLAGCSESEPLAETDPEPTVNTEIISGTNVDPFGAREGTLDDGPLNKLTAYVYASRMDGTDAYVSYAPENLAAQGYMTFVSASTPVDGKYPIAPVGFQREDTSAPADTGDLTLISSPQYYPAQAALHMAALVPAKQDRWTFDTDSKVISCNVDGRTDIMVGIATTMNDGTSLIKKANASATVYPVFDLKHKLTLVRVKVYAPQVKDADAWGKITGIEASATAGVAAGVNNKVDITLEDGSVAASGADTGVVTPFYYYGPIGSETDNVYSGLRVSTAALVTPDNTQYYGPVDIPHPAAAGDADYTSADAGFVAYALIAPFEAIEGINLTVVIYSEKNPGGVVARTGKIYTDAGKTAPYTGSTAGKRFDVTFRLSGVEITGSATITDWEDVYVEDEIEL